MDNLTRRSFLVRGGVGAAGVAAVSAVGLKVGNSVGNDGHTELSGHELAAANDPMIIEIRDAKRGRVTVMRRDKQVTFTDRALVAKALRATS